MVDLCFDANAVMESHIILVLEFLPHLRFSSISISAQVLVCVYISLLHLPASLYF